MTKRKDGIDYKEWVPLQGTKTTGHPLWSAFKTWANENIPNVMLDVYWQAFLAGAKAQKEWNIPVKERTDENKGKQKDPTETQPIVPEVSGE